MNKYQKADKDFEQELIKRGIDPRDVPMRTRYLGTNTPHTYSVNDLSKTMIPAIGGGLVGGYLGGEIAKKYYPGDNDMKWAGRSIGATVGLLPAIPIASRLRHKRLERNIMRRNKLLEGYDKGIVTPETKTLQVKLNSDFTKDEKGEKTKLVLEGDKESLTKLISTLKSEFPEIRLQAKVDIKDQIKSFAKSKLGKLVIGSALLGSLYAIAKPKIVKRLRLKNTQSVDVSEYRYTEDAETVIGTITFFNNFLNNDPIKSAKEYNYNDVEKAYLDALNAIDRSSQSPLEDKDYLNLIWDTVFAFYNATESFHNLEQRVRIRPNIRSIYNV